MTKRLYAMETLDILLLKVVDKTMKQVFTETGTKVVYDFLENNSRLKREEIAKKPKIFSARMKKLLGSGALVVEKIILKNLYSKLELKLEEKEGYEFSDYIKELRKRLKGYEGEGRGMEEHEEMDKKLRDLVEIMHTSKGMEVSRLDRE